MGIVVGGDRAWRVYRKQDLVVALHWVNGEPAMVLFPARMSDSRLARPGQGGGVVPFVIPLAVLHEYVRADGHPHLLRALEGATAAARCFGLQPHVVLLHRIIDAIVETAPDLVAMPPEPPDLARERERAGAVVGELTILDGGRTVLETEVRDPAMGHAVSTTNREGN